ACSGVHCLFRVDDPAAFLMKVLPQMETEVQKKDFAYDAFISYSRRNEKFAEALYKKLADYKPPKGLDLPQRRLNIFLDKRELFGNDLDESLKTNLLNSAKQI